MRLTLINPQHSIRNCKTTNWKSLFKVLSEQSLEREFLPIKTSKFSDKKNSNSHLDHPLETIQTTHLSSSVKRSHAISSPGKKISSWLSDKMLQNLQMTLLSCQVDWTDMTVIKHCIGTKKLIWLIHYWLNIFFLSNENAHEATYQFFTICYQQFKTPMRWEREGLIK